MTWDNFLRMNDWKITNFFALIFIIQIGMWSNTIFHIPLISQIVGFVYLCFIPGALILRLLKLHELGDIQTVLYTVGLSLTCIMFTGLFLNFILPSFGFNKPLTEFNLLVSFTSITIILVVISFIRDNNYYHIKINTKNIFSIQNLFLSLFPFLSIFGTYLVNFYHTNIILLALIFIIAFLAIILTWTDIFSNSYGYFIFIISLTILFSQSLISMSLWGGDGFIEYYAANLVKTMAFWNPSFYDQSSSVLSVVMLEPIFSNITHMEITWVVKIIYPFFLSLVPLGLYLMYDKQTKGKIAILASFYFISISVFFVELLYTQKQIIAELFLVLLLMLLIEKNMDFKIKSLFFVLFSASLVVSHYSISYIFSYFLIFTLIIFIIVNKIPKRLYEILPKFLKNSINSFKNLKLEYISLNFVVLFVVLCLAYYINSASGSPFYALMRVFDHIFTGFYTELLNPESTQGLYYVTLNQNSIYHTITKYLFFISQFFISIGLITVLLKIKTYKFSTEYLYFSIASFSLLVMALIIPNFSGSLDTTRVFQISVITLSPFMIIGFLETSRKISNMLIKRNSDNLIYKIIGIFLMCFLLFNTGWIYEVTNDPVPSSISLSMERINYPVFTQSDIFAVSWWREVRDNTNPLVADFYRTLLINSYEKGTGKRFVNEFSNHGYDPNYIKDNYLFLSSWNMVNHEMYYHIFEGSGANTGFISTNNVTYGKNEIYFNGNASVWL